MELNYISGAYDKEHQEQPLFAGRQTIALVATKQKETETGVSNKDIYIQTEKGSSILAWNAGSICPPYCNVEFDSDQIGITIVDKGNEGMIVA